MFLLSVLHKHWRSYLNLHSDSTQAALKTYCGITAIGSHAVMFLGLPLTQVVLSAACLHALALRRHRNYKITLKTLRHLQNIPTFCLADSCCCRHFDTVFPQHTKQFNKPCITIRHYLFTTLITAHHWVESHLTAELSHRLLYCICN